MHSHCPTLCVCVVVWSWFTTAPWENLGNVKTCEMQAKCRWMSLHSLLFSAFLWCFDVTWQNQTIFTQLGGRKIHSLFTQVSSGGFLFLRELISLGENSQAHDWEIPKPPRCWWWRLLCSSCFTLVSALTLVEKSFSDGESTLPCALLVQ